MRKLKNIDLDDLVKSGIIDESVANNIWTHYDRLKTDAPNRLGIVFVLSNLFVLAVGIFYIYQGNKLN